MQTDNKSAKVGFEDCRAQQILLSQNETSKGEDFKATKYANYEAQLF